MNFKLKLSILFLSLIPIIGQAQEFLTGVVQNTTIVKEAKKGLSGHHMRSAQAVKLPFLDDFSNYSGYPNAQLWLDRQGFVNTGFAVYPPTIGVVTLDILNEYGEVYPQADRNRFSADTLTSNLIRLDTNFRTNRPMSVRDSIYMSFYYQPAGASKSYPANSWEIVGDAPETSDELVLEFGYGTGQVVFTGFHYSDYTLGPGEYYTIGDSIENPYMPGTYYFLKMMPMQARPSRCLQIPFLKKNLFGMKCGHPMAAMSANGLPKIRWIISNRCSFPSQMSSISGTISNSAFGISAAWTWTHGVWGTL